MENLITKWDSQILKEITEKFKESGHRDPKFPCKSEKNLSKERECAQKKTFSKWINSHLVGSSYKVVNLYSDLKDGRILLKLLEVLSGDSSLRATVGRMRIHHLENVNKALSLLRKHGVHLENIGSHDIVDGNRKLTLGLIWTLILRFQTQSIILQEESASIKSALLSWCQEVTAGYNGVKVTNFSTSWRDGLAFNAIIHRHRPDLIQFQILSKYNPVFNLNQAFSIAETLGLSKLLDPEDVMADHPDEKSIIIYLLTFYNYFNRINQTLQKKVIGNVFGFALNNGKMIEEYEGLTSALVKWIEAMIVSLSDALSDSLVGINTHMTQLNKYKTTEKPLKVQERSNLEILLFTLQSKMISNNQKPYSPNKEVSSGIQKAWKLLEAAERKRERSLMKKLKKQHIFESNFELTLRKETKGNWLSENLKRLSEALK